MGRDVRVKNVQFVYTVDMWSGERWRIDRFIKSLESRKYISYLQDNGSYRFDENYHQLFFLSPLKLDELEKNMDKNECFYGIVLYDGEDIGLAWGSREMDFLQECVEIVGGEIFLGYCLRGNEKGV